MYSPATVAFAVVLHVLIAAHHTDARSEAAPDTRSQEEIVRDYMAGDDHPRHSGARLFQLDETAAWFFFRPYLDKNQPEKMRLRTIDVIRTAGFRGAFPELRQMVILHQDSEQVRCAALCALIALKDPELIETADKASKDSSPFVRKVARDIFRADRARKAADAKTTPTR